MEIFPFFLDMQTHNAKGWIFCFSASEDGAQHMANCVVGPLATGRKRSRHFSGTISPVCCTYVIWQRKTRGVSTQEATLDLTSSSPLTAAGLQGGHGGTPGCPAPAASLARREQGTGRWLSGSQFIPEPAPGLCNYTFSICRLHADCVI